MESLEPRLLLSDVGGYIATDTVWDNTAEPYCLVDNLIVDKGATLTLAPGVTLQSGSYNLDIYVDGRMEGADATVNLLGSVYWGDTSAVYVRSGGRVTLEDSTVHGPGLIDVMSGGEASLTNTVLTDGLSVSYDSGSSGLVDDGHGSWNLGIAAGSSATIAGVLDVNNLSLGTPLTFDHATVDVMSLTASATVTQSTVGYLNVWGVAPTFTDDTFTDVRPIRIFDPDFDPSGFTGSTFSASDGWVNLEGTLEGTRTLGFIDGALGRYTLTNTLAVAATGALTLAPGVTLQSGSYNLDIYVDGRMEGADATVNLLGSVYWGDTSAVYVRSGGRVTLEDSTVHGPGLIDVLSGGEAALTNTALADGPSVSYESGSSGLVDAGHGNWNLGIAAGSSATIAGVLDVNSLSLGTPLAFDHATVDVMSLSASATVTHSTLGYLNVWGVAPTFTDDTFTDVRPIRIFDPDFDPSGFTGSTFSAADGWVNLEGTLEGTRTLGFIDGALGRYTLTNTLIVAGTGDLTLAPGVTLQSGSYAYDIYVDGRMTGSDATVDLLGSTYWGDTSAVYVRSGGRVTLEDSTVHGPGLIDVLSGGEAALTNTALADGPSVSYESGSSGVVDDGHGSWNLGIAAGSAATIAGVLDVNNLSLGTPLVFAHATVDVMSLSASATVTQSTVGYLNVWGVAPTFTDDTFTDVRPIRIFDPDFDPSGFTGSTFSVADGWVNLEGTLEGTRTLGFIDGALGRYTLTNTLMVAATGDLTLAPGVTLQSGSYAYDIYVDGRMTGSDATVDLLGSTYWGDRSTLFVRGGGRLSLSDALISGSGSIEVLSGGQADFTNVVMPAVLLCDAGSSGSIRYSRLQYFGLADAAATMVRLNDLSAATVAVTGAPGATIDLSANWWGSIEPVDIAARIIDHGDDASRPMVVFEPFLTTDPRVVDATGPRVVGYAPTLPQRPGLAAVDVVFSESIDTAGIDWGDIRITGPLGPVAIAGIEFVEITRYRMTFDPLTAEGEYRVHVGPGVPDWAGNAMNQDGDAANGEPEDAYEFTFRIDDTGPQALSHTPTGDVSAVVNHVDVAFSEPLNLATFTSDQVSIEGPGGPISTPISILDRGNNTYRVGFNAQQAVGAYHVRIGPAVADIAGNAMDQDSDGAKGQPDDVFDAAFTIRWPDLEPYNVDAPAAASLGQTVHVTWKTHNIGDAATTAAWADALYLSTDSQWDPQDVLLGSVAGPSLAVGAHCEPMADVAIPFNAAGGDMFILVRSDDGQAQIESREDNNTAPWAIRVLKPDLVPTIVDAPDAARTGEQVAVTLRVDNVGPGDALGHYTDRLYLSNNDSLGGDMLLWWGDADSHLPLAANHGYQFDATFTMPSVAANGTYWLLWSTDDGRQLPEADEGHNVALHALTVTRTAELSTAAPTSSPPAPILGETVRLATMVTNAGPEDAPATSVAFYLGNPLAGGLLLETEAVPALGSGQVCNVGMNWETTGLAVGAYNIYAVVDPDHLIDEVNEADNTSHSVITVGRPSLAANWVAPGELEAGQHVTVTLQLTNQGDRPAENVDLVLPGPLPAGVALLATDPATGGSGLSWHWASIGGGQTVQVSLGLGLDYLLTGSIAFAGSATYSDRLSTAYPTVEVTRAFAITPDHTAPALVVAVDPARTSGAPVQVRVESNEPLGAAPALAAEDAAGHALAVSYAGRDGAAYRYTVDVTGSAEGDASLQAAVVDQSGNRRTGLSTFLVDRTGPAFVVSLNGHLVPAGMATLVVTASELLAANPTVTVLDAHAAPIAMSAPVRSGASYVYTLTITDATAQGEASIAVAGTDLTGNSGTGAASFYVDSIAPGCTVVAPTRMGLGSYNVDVTPGELLPAIPAVSLVAADGSYVTVLSPTINGNTYTYAARIYPGTANGAATVRVSIHDAAGNVYAEARAAWIDTTGPVLAISVSPDPPRGGSSVEITVTSDEALSAPPTVVASLDGKTPLPLGAPTQSGNVYTYTCSAPEVAVLSATATDLLGNAGTKSLTYADLSCTSSELTLSAVPNLGSDVTAHVVIHNTGQTRVENVAVRFYHGVFWPTAAIGADQYVSLDPGESTTVSQLWPASAQGPDQVLFAIIDPDRQLPETDEGNNVALRGPVVISAMTEHRSYLLSDTAATVWAVTKDSTTNRLLGDSEASVSVWIEDSAGTVVLGPWPAVYIAGQNHFEATFDPSAVPGPADYTVVAQVSGVSFAPATSRSPVKVLRDFTVTAQADATWYERGASVHLTGHVADVLGVAVANTPVDLEWTSRFGERHFSVTTDAAGDWSFDYPAMPLEAGAFQVIASVAQGEFTRSSAPASFEIEGLFLQAQWASMRIFTGENHTLTYRISNVGASPVTGLSVTLDNLTAGAGPLAATLDAAGMPTTLAPGESAAFTVGLLSGQTPADYVLRVRVTDAEGAAEQFDMDVSVASTSPVVAFAPTALETVVANGGQLIRDITLTNTGWQDVTDAVLAANLPSWVSMMGTSAILGRVPGQKGLMDVGFGVFDYCALLVRIGADGPIRQVGSDGVFNADAEGELYFRINEADASLADNRGSLTVRVFTPGSTMPTDTTVEAARGWQASGQIVVLGQQIHTQASGVWYTAVDGPRDADGNGAVYFSLRWAPNDPALVSNVPTDWTIRLTGSTIADCILPIRSWVVSTDTGNATFNVTDPIGRTLEGIEVTLYSQQYDPVSHSFPVYRGTTDASGHAEFSNLAPGSYGYLLHGDGIAHSAAPLGAFASDTASSSAGGAQKYEDQSGSVSVGQGQEAIVESQLNPDLVTVQWVVTPTTIQDHYDIVLRTTYRVEETGEPTPPVLVGKPILLTLNPGGSVEGSLSVINVGGRPAQNLVFTAPNVPYCDFAFITTTATGQVKLVSSVSLSSLLPGEGTSIGYRMTLHANAPRGLPQDGTVKVDFEYKAAAGVRREEAQVVVRINTPTDDLALNPGALTLITTSKPGLNTFIEDIGSVTVTNVGYDPVTSFTGPFGVFVKESLNPIDILKTLCGIEDQPFGVGYGVIGGSFDQGSLAPGESTTMTLTSVDVSGMVGAAAGDVTNFFNFDLLSFTEGLAGFAAHWGGASGATTLHGVPIIIISIMDFGFGGGGGGGVYVDQHVSGGYGGIGEFLQGLIPSFSSGAPDQPVQASQTWPTPDGPMAPPPQQEKYVTFDIHQEATFDRQAFTGSLQIHNGSTLYALQDLRINIEIADESGAVIAADHRQFNELYFAAPQLLGLASIDGSGTIDPMSDGTVDWLIIPTEQAGGKHYLLRAHVLWNWAGVPGEVYSAPAEIQVDPQPHIDLNYFIQPNFGNNEPFYLGVSVSNTGSGAVHNFRIDTGQPEIVWSQTTYANPTVVIDGGYLVNPDGSTTSSGGLTLNFGTIGPGQTAAGWWQLRASPGGTVTSFKVQSVTHDEALGGQATSLLSATASTQWVLQFGLDLSLGSPHQNLLTDSSASTGSGDLTGLGHGVLLDSDGNGTPDAILDTVTFDEYAVTPVAGDVDYETDFGMPQIHVTVDKSDGWIYTSVNNPFAGTLEVAEIRTADGRVLSAHNWWEQNGHIAIVDDAAQEYVIVFRERPPATGETAQVALDGVQYTGWGASATVTVIDGDLNLNAGGSNDTATVTVTSDSDPTGEVLTLTETKQEGVFIGTFGFEASPVAGNHKVFIAPGQLVTVTYHDALDATGGTRTTIAQAQWLALNVPITVALDPASNSGTPGDPLTRSMTPTVSGMTSPQATVVVEITGPNGYLATDAVVADGAGAWSCTVSAAHAMADGQYTARASATDADGNTSVGPVTVGFRVDVTPPRPAVTHVGGQFGGTFDEVERSTVNRVRIEFSEAVWITYPTALVLYNRTTHTAIDLAAATVEGSGTTVLTWDLSNVSLTDGYYTATISAADVTGRTGKALDGNGDTTGGDDYSFAFHKLLCDVNGDAKVNLGDLSAWMMNYDPAGTRPHSPATGDFNLDGKVDKDDLALWRQQYNPVGLKQPRLSRPLGDQRGLTAAMPSDEEEAAIATFLAAADAQRAAATPPAGPAAAGETTPATTPADTSTPSAIASQKPAASVAEPARSGAVTAPVAAPTPTALPSAPEFGLIFVLPAAKSIESMEAPEARSAALQARTLGRAGASFGAVFVSVESPRPLVFSVATMPDALADVLAEAAVPAGLESVLETPSLGLWGSVRTELDGESGRLEERGGAAMPVPGAGRASATGAVAGLGATADSLVGAVVLGALQAGPPSAADAASMRTRQRRSRRGRPHA